MGEKWELVDWNTAAPSFLTSSRKHSFNESFALTQCISERKGVEVVGCLAYCTGLVCLAPTVSWPSGPTHLSRLRFLSAPPLASLPGIRTADRLLAENGGIPGDTGIFGETAYTPGGSPRFSSKGKQDSRRKLLLNLTYLNLFLALVLIIVGSAGPQYPGHSGTTNNPVSTWVSPRSAIASVQS